MAAFFVYGAGAGATTSICDVNRHESFGDEPRSCPACWVAKAGELMLLVECT